MLLRYSSSLGNRLNSRRSTGDTSPLFTSRGVRRSFSMPGVRRSMTSSMPFSTFGFPATLKKIYHAWSGFRPARMTASRITIVGVSKLYTLPCTFNFHVVLRLMKCSIPVSSKLMNSSFWISRSASSSRSRSSVLSSPIPPSSRTTYPVMWRHGHSKRAPSTVNR
ncbi:hypothetical protein D3C86_1451120 [compost metagenome]